MSTKREQHTPQVLEDALIALRRGDDDAERWIREQFNGLLQAAGAALPVVLESCIHKSPSLCDCEAGKRYCQLKHAIATTKGGA